MGVVLNDKWTLERLLGVGGMGAVYAGRHRNGARAAVKLLHPELAREFGAAAFVLLISVLGALAAQELSTGESQPSAAAIADIPEYPQQPTALSLI